MNSKMRFLRSALVLMTVLSAALTYGCGKGGGGGITGPGDGGGDDNGTPAPTAGFSSDRSAGDVPFTVAFTNQSSGATSYRWDFGDGTSSAEASPRHEYSALGRYTVRLIAVNASGEEHSQTMQITANRVVQAFAATQAYGRYWPGWAGVGDYEFGGHGPDTWMDASLHSSPDGSQLYVDLHMKARETQSDWSTAEGSWRRVVYTAPSGTRITTLPSVTELHEAFRDAGHGAATTPGNALGYFVWKGDTDGEDIRNQTTDDTHMYFHMRPFPIRLSPR